MTASPDASAVIAIWQFCANEHNTSWTHFIAVATAVIAIALSGKYEAASSRAKAILMVGFGIVAVATGTSLLENLPVYNAATDELLKLNIGSVAAALRRQDRAEWYIILPLHLAVDGATLLILWHQGFRAKPSVPQSASGL